MFVNVTSNLRGQSVILELTASTLKQNIISSNSTFYNLSVDI